jgi:hypothetical protein
VQHPNFFDFLRTTLFTALGWGSSLFASLISGCYSLKTIEGFSAVYKMNGALSKIFIRGGSFSALNRTDLLGQKTGHQPDTCFQR